MEYLRVASYWELHHELIDKDHEGLTRCLYGNDKRSKAVIKSSSEECGTCNNASMCLAKSCMLYGPGLSKEVNKFGLNEKAVPFEGRVMTCSL